MHRLIIVLAIAVGFMHLGFTSTIFAQSVPDPLQLEHKIILGNVSGRIDHLAVDLAHHRLFVAELGDDTVAVVDLDAQKVVHRLSDLKEPQGIAYVQANDSLYVANGGDGSVRVFRDTEYAPAGRIDLGADADNIRLDLPDTRLLVGYGSGGIGSIDLRSNNKVESFPLQAHPESFQLDAETHQIFVNLPNNRALAVLDATTGRQRATWSLAHGGNFPMALDTERQRILVAFRSPPKFAAFSWQTGDVVSEIDTCGDADDLFLDAKRRLVYVTCGTGFIDVLRAEDSKYSRLTRIPGEMEVEFQPAGVLGSNGQRTLVAPATVLNFGLVKNWEAVFEGRVETPFNPSGPTSLTDAGAFLKYVLRPGVLQDQAGPSIATEFGALLPDTIGNSRFGASVAAIISQRWDWGTAHLNIAGALTREQHADLFTGIVLEGPHKWAVRPVAEFFYEEEFGQAHTFSALIGAIWQMKDNLSFDVGFRHAIINGAGVNEVRAGLTYGFPLRLLGGPLHK